MDINYQRLVTPTAYSYHQNTSLALSQIMPTDVTPYYVDCRNILPGIKKVDVEASGLTISDICFDAVYNNDGSIYAGSNGTIYSFTISNGAENTSYLITATITDINDKVYTQQFTIYVSATFISSNPPLVLGPQGIQGNQGIAGPQGVAGPKGDQGTAGSDATVNSQTIIATEKNPSSSLGDVVDAALGANSYTDSQISDLSGGIQGVQAQLQQSIGTLNSDISTVSSTANVTQSKLDNEITPRVSAVEAKTNSLNDDGTSYSGNIDNSTISYTPNKYDNNSLGTSFGKFPLEEVISSIQLMPSSIHSQLDNQILPELDGMSGALTKVANNFSSDFSKYTGIISNISSDSGNIKSDGSGNLTVSGTVSTSTTGTILPQNTTSSSGNTATQTFTLPHDGVYAIRTVTIGTSTTAGNICQQGFDDFSVYQKSGTAQIQSSINEQSYTSFGSVSNFAVSLSASGTKININSHATDGNTAGTWTWTSRVEYTLIVPM